MYTGRAMTRDPIYIPVRRSQRGPRRTLLAFRACVRDGRRATDNALHRGPATALSGPMPTAGSTRSGPTCSAVLAAGSLQQGARARAPPPTGTCPNARRPHSAARPLLSEGSGGATCDDEGLNDREVRRTRTSRTGPQTAVDTSVMDAMVASASETMAEGSTAANSPGEAETTTMRGGSGCS